MPSVAIPPHGGGPPDKYRTAMALRSTMAMVAQRPPQLVMQMADRLEPRDLFKLAFLRDARLSPCGQFTAYAVSRTDEDEWIELWIVPTSGGPAKRILDRGAGRPRWSPDGQKIAVVSSQGLTVVAPHAANVVTEIYAHDVELFSLPSWSPDGQRIAIAIRERASISNVNNVPHRNFRAEGYGNDYPTSERIACIDLATRECEFVTSDEDGLCVDPHWSPLGHHIAFRSRSSISLQAKFESRLGVYESATRSITYPFPGWAVGALTWHPNGARLLLLATDDATLTIPNYSLWNWDLGARDLEFLFDDISSNIGCSMHHDMPCWDLTDTAEPVVTDSSAIVSVQRGGAVEIVRIDLNAKSVETIISGGRTCIVLDHRHGTTIFAAMDLLNPPELFMHDIRTGREIRITYLNENALSDWPDFSIRNLTVVSTDGVSLDAWFLQRSDLTGPLPTILFIHGGPFNAVGQSFRFDFVLLASQGFGLAFANFRGSSGYGDRFMREIMGDWCGRAFPDHMATVDAVIEHQLADPNRLGVWGHSYGGSATCWLIGHSSRFKAAIAEASVPDLAMQYHLSDASGVLRTDIGGSPSEMPDVYQRCSPISKAHLVRTPTLLIHGLDDVRCPIAGAESFFAILKENNCQANLVRIAGMDHMGDATGPLYAREAQNAALVCWFDMYLN